MTFMANRPVMAVTSATEALKEVSTKSSCRQAGRQQAGPEQAGPEQAGPAVSRTGHELCWLCTSPAVPHCLTPSHNYIHSLASP